MKKLLYILAGILLLIIIALNFPKRYAPEFDHDSIFLRKDCVSVTAHRGASGIFPESTIPSFQYAAENGADILEMDMVLTADDQLIALHDRTVDRTTEGNGPARSFSLAEIQELDAGYNFQFRADSPEGAEDPAFTGGASESYPFRGQGYYIPAITEIVETFPDQNFLLEMKPFDGMEIVDVFSDFVTEWKERDPSIVERLNVASFDGDMIREFRRRHPDIITGLAADEARSYIFRRIAGLHRSSPTPGPLIQVPPAAGPLTIVTPDFVEASRQKNAFIQVWTINEADAMRNFIEMNIHSIMTDYPHVLAEILVAEYPQLRCQ